MIFGDKKIMVCGLANVILGGCIFDKRGNGFAM